MSRGLGDVYKRQLSDELIAAQWFDESEVGVRLADSSVAKLLFNDIKGAKL